MGAYTSSPKRHQVRSPDFHDSKKPRLSSMIEIQKQTVGTSNSTVSRISSYPKTTSKTRRKVHAPKRTLKFGLIMSKFGLFREKVASARKGDEMGTILSKKFESAKKHAIETFRFSEKEKEIAVLEEDEKKKHELRGKSCFGSKEEDDGKEGTSAVLDQDSQEVVLVVDDEEHDNYVTLDKNVAENAEKLLDSLKLDRNVVAPDKEVYKKLLENVERSSGKLKALKFDIEFYEKKRRWPVTKPEKSVEEIHEPFIPLTDEEEAEVDRGFSPSNRSRILVTHKNSCIDITGEILWCLKPGAWLNDEVINVYLELLKERERREPQKYLNCHFFNTFFYKKLTGAQKKVYDYKAVRRWTSERKLGYFLVDCDKIFVPIHREIHWCLAIINKKDKKFQYLDSLKGRDLRVLKFLANYYVEEVKDKSNKDIDVSDWEHEFVEDLPEQQNGYDCGMFMLKYADFYSRGLGLWFGQEHMPYFRRRTAKEILRLRAN